MKQNIGFIGCGNMAKALINGMIQTDSVNPENIIVSNPSMPKLNEVRENWNMKIKPYYVAKHYADRILMNSDLQYTIVKPGGLLDGPGTGKIQVAEKLERGTIPREDVASTIIEVLREPKMIRQSFDLVSGDLTIKEAIADF